MKIAVTSQGPDLSSQVDPRFGRAKSSIVLDTDNCLFAHGRSGITGELKARFCHPVATGQGSLVRAWIERSSPPYHLLKAELIQVCALDDTPVVGTLSCLFDGLFREERHNANL